MLSYDTVRKVKFDSTIMKKDEIHRFVVKGNQHEVNFIQLENTLFS